MIHLSHFQNNDGHNLTVLDHFSNTQFSRAIISVLIQSINSSIFQLSFPSLLLICSLITFGSFFNTIGINNGPTLSSCIPVVFNALTFILILLNKSRKSFTFDPLTASRSIKLFIWQNVMICGLPYLSFNKFQTLL